MHLQETESKWISVRHRRIARLLFLREPVVVYACVALFFGFLFLVATPPCAVPDEPAHLKRIFRIAQGDFYAAPQVKLPDLASYNSLCDRVGIGQDPQHLLSEFGLFLGEKGGGLRSEAYGDAYPPVPYLPAALAVKLFSFFEPSSAVYLYTARLATFLAALMITAYAISIAPCARWLMVALALMPTRLYLMASISPDAVTSAVALLWVALLLSFASKPDEMRLQRIVVLVFTATALVLSKTMYVLLLLLVFALPLKYWLGRHGVKGGVTFAVLAVVVFASASVLVSRYFDGMSLTPSATSEYRNNASAGMGMNGFLANVNPSLQARLLIDEPARLFEVLAKGYASRGQSLLRQTIGVFGWANVYLHSVLYAVAYLLMFGTFWIDRQMAPGVFRWLAGLIVLMAVCAIPIMMYLVWTPVGADRFDGVLGRYYIPYIPLMFLAIGGRGRSIRGIRKARLVVVSGLVVLLLFSVGRLLQAYYMTPPNGGSLVLVAKANNTGIAMISVKTGLKEKWKNKGVINFVPTLEPATYECQLPAQRFTAVRIVLDTTGSMDVQIDRITAKNSAGKTVRDFSWQAMSQSGVPAVVVWDNTSRSESRLFRLGAGRSSNLIIEQAVFDLSSTVPP